MKCGIASSHLTSHSQRLRWPSSSPSTCSGYGDGAACSVTARTPLNKTCRRRRRRLQGLSRVTSAAAMSASGDRGAAETIPSQDPEVPRTDLLLDLILGDNAVRAWSDASLRRRAVVKTCRSRLAASRSTEPSGTAWYRWRYCGECLALSPAAARHARRFYGQHRARLHARVDVDCARADLGEHALLRVRGRQPLEPGGEIAEALEAGVGIHGEAVCPRACGRTGPRHPSRRSRGSPFPSPG